MKLTFFGRLRDAIGSGELECSPPTNIVDSESLRAWIGELHLALLDPNVRIAVDDVVSTGPVSVSNAKEIAFLPPVSGG